MLRQKPKTKSKNFWLITFLMILLLSLVLLAVYITISYMLHNFSLMFGYLLCFIVPYSFLFFDWVVRKVFLTGMQSKGWTITWVTILHAIKYGLFFLLPLCGFLINKKHNEDIFSIWGIIAPLTITITYIIYCRVFYWYIAKKESAQKKSIN